MTLLLLQAVVAEIAAHLTQQEVLRASFPGSSRYVLRFATAARDNLLISVRPERPRLHLLPRPSKVREAPPDRFAALLDAELSGAVLESIASAPGDRVVTMDFRQPRTPGGDAGRRLVVELFGRSANALLLDRSGIVRGVCRDLKSAFRSPVVGSPYVAPRPPSTEAASLEPKAAGAAASLGVFVASARPLESYREGDVIRRDEIRVEMRPLEPALAAEGPAPACLTRFASPSEAAQVGFDLIERLQDFQDRRDHHQALARREEERLGELESRLLSDLEKARGSVRFRRHGEALLAGLSRAVVDGGTASVPDPERLDGSPLVVPIDPALSLQENAQVLFGRYKKGKRGIATIESRLEAARTRRQAWHALLARAQSARAMEDLEVLRDDMAGLGLVHAARSRKSGPPPPREAPTRVRRHTTADGFVILVGRSGAENDALTFKVASPEDFWLHAADSPGAHVVVRNPRRAKTLPERTLRAAAEIAAHYSGAKGEAKVDVHYTQRKHVHKRKGMPPGQVLLRRFRSIRVEPRLPERMAEDV